MPHPRCALLIVLTIPIFLSGVPVWASTWHVDDDASSNGDGTSWPTAYKYLQDALAAADVDDEVHIAGGVYTPDRDESGHVTPGDREATFELANRVAVRGGFAGQADPGDPDRRDIQGFETILSGNLDGDDTPTNNSYHVVTANSTDATAVLEGVSIILGYAGDVGAEDVGAGVLNGGGSPTLLDCTLRENIAVYGGGMFCGTGSAADLTRCDFEDNSALISGGGMYSFGHAGELGSTLTDCTFTGNSATDFGGGMRNWASSPTLIRCDFEGNWTELSGGAMANGGASSPSLTRCTFTGNRTDSFFAPFANYGGAMSNYDESNPTLIDCAFRANTVVGWPGYAGAMYNEQSSPSLSECLFLGNHTNLGGGMYSTAGGTPTLTACTFNGNTATSDGGGVYNQASNMILVNTVFSGNVAGGGDGGAVFNDLCNATITNCTFSGNTAESRGGGLYNYVGCEITLNNGVLWENEDSSGTVFSAQIYNNPSNLLEMSYSCVQGLPDGTRATGNTGHDPNLVDPAGPDGDVGTEDDNVRLLHGSAAIDAGTNGADIDVASPGYQPLPDTDRDGYARFVDDPRTADSGSGVPPIVDMGAYEFRPGDCDHDGDVELIDYAELEGCLEGPAGGLPLECDCFDLDGSGDVGLADFAVFQSAFTGP